MMLFQKGKVNSALLIFIVVVVCGTVVAYFIRNNSSFESEKDLSDQYPQSRNLKTNLVLQNSTSRLLENTDVRIFLPFVQNAHQYSKLVSANQEVRNVKDQIGNQQAYLRLQKVEPGQSIPIILDVKFYQSDTPVQTDEPDINQYLYADNIDSDSLVKLNELADQLNAENFDKTVDNILQWWRANKGNLIIQEIEDKTPENVVQNNEETSVAQENEVQIDVDKKVELGEQKTIKSDKSDDQLVNPLPVIVEHKSITFHDALSGEFKSPFADASLLTAMFRVAKIPSRTVVGVNASNKTTITSKDIIFWIEYFDGSAWRAIDLVNSQVFQNPQAYIAIRAFRDLPTEFTDEKEINFLYESAGLAVAPGSLRILFN